LVKAQVIAAEHKAGAAKEQITRIVIFDFLKIFHQSGKAFLRR
jgi:hypothetical protein